MNIYRLTLPNIVIIQFNPKVVPPLKKGRIKIAGIDVVYYPERNEMYFECLVQEITATWKKIREGLAQYNSIPLR